MEDTININLLIADRTYPLRVRPEEEEGVRNAAKLINEKIREFQNLYEGKDKQDYLAMAILVFAVETLNKQNASPNTESSIEESLLQGVKQLEQMLLDV